MAAYVIAAISVKDADVYAEYRKQVPPTIQKYGGRFVVRGGAHETLEGEWLPERLVILEFPDMKTAKTWYYSDDYQPLATLRQKASTGSLVFVEGA